jgi:hypothetical protein
LTVSVSKYIQNVASSLRRCATPRDEVVGYRLAPIDPDEPVALIANHVIEDLSLSINAKVAYAVLCSYRDEPTPSDTILASMVPCSDSEFRHAIEALVDRRIVVRLETPRDGCRYMLTDTPPGETTR